MPNLFFYLINLKVLIPPHLLHQEEPPGLGAQSADGLHQLRGPLRGGGEVHRRDGEEVPPGDRQAQDAHEGGTDEDAAGGQDGHQGKTTPPGNAD